MRARLIGCLVMGLSVGACSGREGEGDAGNDVAEAAATLDADQQQMKELSVDERSARLANAIREQGHRCEGMAASEEVVASANRPVYAVICQDKAEYLVVVAPEGNLKVQPALPAEDQ